MAATAQATAQATAKKNDPVISPNIGNKNKLQTNTLPSNTLPPTITPAATTPATPSGTPSVTPSGTPATTPATPSATPSGTPATPTPSITSANKNKKPTAEPKEPSKLVEVSGLKYWLQGDAPFNNDNNADKPGARYLSYNIFLVISLLGGFLALDHLYLRSPLTFVAKLAVNLTFFGVWWIWDAAQALFNEPVVRVYGLGIPGLGPQGIGAGVLAEEKPDGKHMRFFTYAVALIFGGLIGLDSFLVGQTQMGFFRLIATLTFVLLPASGLEWGYKMYQFFFNTKAIVAENAGYFGANGSSSPMGFISSLIERMLGPLLQPIKDTIITPVTTSIDGVVATANKAIDAGIEVADTVKTVVETASKATSALPATSLYSAVTTPALEAAKKQIGGANEEPSNIKLLPYTLVGTILLIFASGLYKNFTIKNNVAKDDSPPEPRPVRNTA